MKNLFLISVVVSCVLIPGISYSFCFVEAGNEYGLSPQLLWAIAKIESNFNPYVINYNKNGSFDYGVMQINSLWYKKIGPEGWALLNDACYNVKVGAWILGQCVTRYGYTWEAVGCYNASSAGKRTLYANKIYNVLVKSQITGG